MILTKKNERWSIRKFENELPKKKYSKDEKSVLNRSLFKYKKQLGLKFINSHDYHKLPDEKREEFKEVYEMDKIKISFISFLWEELKEKNKYRCLNCKEHTKLLFIHCNNIKQIEKLRIPDFDLLCTKCWYDKTRASY